MEKERTSTVMSRYMARSSWAKKTLFALTTILSFLAVVSYLPIFGLGWVLHKVARLVLALAYLLMLRFREARDIVKYMFNRHSNV